MIKQAKDDFKSYLFKCTTQNIEKTYGSMLIHCKHLEYKASARTQQAQCSNSLSIMQRGNMYFLFSGIISTVYATIGSYLTDVTHGMKINNNVQSLGTATTGFLSCTDIDNYTKPKELSKNLK